MEPRARVFWPLFKLSAPVQEVQKVQKVQKGQGAHGVQEAPASTAGAPSAVQPALHSAPKP